MKTTKERFDDKYAPEPNTGCWLWVRATNRRGYGLFKLNGTAWLAHRVSYLLHHGQDPGTGVVMHRCDTPACVNPHHLALGTHAENMADMAAKLRGRGGADKAAQTHCIHGHEFTISNTYIKSNGTRSCKQCAAWRRQKAKPNELD